MTQNSLFPAPDEHDPGGKVRVPLPAGWLAEAEWSGARAEYRDLLRYRWATGPVLLAALMNPSVADEGFCDPTLAKIGRLANRWGFSGFTVVNACNYRCTDSKLLCKMAMPVSPSNADAWRRAAAEATMILVGYGKLHKSLQPYAAAMVRVLRESGKPLHVLGLGITGTPLHPLYQREDITPVEWKEK